MQRPRLVTRSGIVEGRRANVPSGAPGASIVAFRGVPYAAPPVGRRRFAPTEPEVPWTGSRDAGAFGPAGPQRPSALMRMLGMDGETQSEDCLTLNVWTPSLDGARRPILVWLHGGAFTAGSGSMPAFDGARLAHRGDVVVVTVNYRLGALGFLIVPELLDAGEVGANFGLLDQIAALRWVREHGALLGGDAERVVLFGESAGAMSIGALLGAPAARPLFHGAVLQSGAAHNVSPLASGLRIAGLFREALGRPHADLDALRALPVSAILDAQHRVVDESWRTVEGLAFQPVCEGGGAASVIPRPPLEAVAAGDVRHVSLVAGTNLDEWKLFALADAKLAGLDEDGLVRRLLRAPPGRDAPPEEREAVARRAIQVYRQGRERAEPRDLWLAMQTDRLFRVPAIRLLEAQRAHQPGCYAYLFSWPSPAGDGVLGACHGVEIPFVFGTYEEERQARLVGDGPDARRLCERVQDAWLGFAHRSDPGWPSYDESKRATCVLGRECVVESDPMGAERRFWDGLV
jgi:para-nitrobenzyl esterase